MKVLKVLPVAFLAAGLVLTARDKRLDNKSGLWDVRVLSKVGFIDSTGRLVIPARFEETGFFSEGLCPARQGAMWGYIDGSGRWAIPPRFSQAGPFSEGLAAAGLAGRLAFIDLTGRQLPLPAVDEAGLFREGLARVKAGGSWGFIDSRGNRVIPPVYEDAGDFFGGLAAVRMRSKWGYIDRTGRMAIPPRFEEASDFQESRAVVRTPVGLRYIDARGMDLFPGRVFQEAREFSGGLAPVRLAPTGKFGYINSEGAVAIPARWEDALPFNDGLAAVRQRERWGYIDPQGIVVIDFRYERADFFINGLAKVFLANRECYLDRRGRLVWEPGRGASSLPLPVATKTAEAKTAGETTAQETVIRYNMGGLTEILIRGGKLTYRYSKYKGANPVAAGTLEDYEFFTETAEVTAGEEREILDVFARNAFDRMEAEYGDLEPGARYYGVTISLSSGKAEKSVLFKSSPQTVMPLAFQRIERALFDLVKMKFGKE